MDNRPREVLFILGNEWSLLLKLHCSLSLHSSNRLALLCYSICWIEKIMSERCTAD